MRKWKIESRDLGEGKVHGELVFVDDCDCKPLGRFSHIVLGKCLLHGIEVELGHQVFLSSFIIPVAPSIPDNSPISFVT